jgi:hypothetical protein
VVEVVDVARLVVVGATVVAAVEVGASVDGTVDGGAEEVVTCSNGRMAAADAARAGTMTHNNPTRTIPILARIAAETTLRPVLVEEA